MTAGLQFPFYDPEALSSRLRVSTSTSHMDTAHLSDWGEPQHHALPNRANGREVFLMSIAPENHCYKRHPVFWSGSEHQHPGLLEEQVAREGFSLD